MHTTENSLGDDLSFLGNDTFLCSTEISVLAGVLRDIFFEFCLATFCDVDADFVGILG
jgi:hypothetical protein